MFWHRVSKFNIN